MKPPAVVQTPQQRQVRNVALVIIVVALVVLALRSCFAPHENAREQVARNVTLALQSNDIAAVQKYQNAETATQVTRAVVGRAADVLSPLGQLQRITETPIEPDRRTYRYDLTFAKGSVDEQIQFDPDGKIFHFRYDVVPKP